MESTADDYVVTIKDQREKLGKFITGELRQAQTGLTFDSIYRRVCQQHDNFFTKDYIFKVIDELFQLGLIYELGKQIYQLMDNTFMQ
jgi:hypothetical protein